MIVVIALLTGLVGAPSPAPRESGGVTLAAVPGLTWSPLSGVPSGDVSLFVGAPLCRRTRAGIPRFGAIGYEFTLSAGKADLASAFFSFGGDYGLVYHRHHVALYGQSRALPRVFFSGGAGLLLWRSILTAFEADLRVGAFARLGGSERVRAIFGGHARLVAILGGIPSPHLGLFAGVIFR